MLTHSAKSNGMHLQSTGMGNGQGRTGPAFPPAPAATINGVQQRSLEQLGSSWQPARRKREERTLDKLKAYKIGKLLKFIAFTMISADRNHHCFWNVVANTQVLVATAPHLSITREDLSIMWMQ